ncbi:MAG: ASCH domain-containing protein [Firmicutes bacterium]|nr:ASCH domain-containing protein [Bacillota bacterium]
MSDRTDLLQEADKVWQAYLTTGKAFYLDATQPKTIQRDHKYSLLSFPSPNDDAIRNVLKGLRTSRASVHCAYNGFLPQKGDFYVLCSQTHGALAVVRTFRIQEMPFNRITEDAIRSECEGDGSLALWKDIHRERFAKILKRDGLTFTEDIKVIFEFFEVVYYTDEGKKIGFPRKE